MAFTPKLEKGADPEQQRNPQFGLDGTARLCTAEGVAYDFWATGHFTTL